MKDAIGQFTVEEYDEMLRFCSIDDSMKAILHRNDLIHLQKVLGDNQFLMGDSPSRF